MTPEALRVFPMALRVERYSWPAESSKASTPRLPIIHIIGDMGTPEYGPVRTMKGTVSLIGDNAVRWSMVGACPLLDRVHANSTHQTLNRTGDQGPEWSTEGVQIGALGSALGVIGMWTGAAHARSDPLGPFWFWKVG